MSSGKYRSVNSLLPQLQEHNHYPATPDRTMGRMKQYAVANTGHFARTGLLSGDGGGHGERGGPAGRAGAGRTGASQGGGGDRAAVQLRRVLPGRGQGTGQVRDVAVAPGRARAGHGGGGGPDRKSTR